MLSVSKFASVFANGFAGTVELADVSIEELFELLNVFCRVPLSSVLPAVPSDPALNGSSGDSSSELSVDGTLDGGGDVT